MRRIIATAMSLVLFSMLFGQTSLNESPGGILSIKKGQEFRTIAQGYAHLEKSILITNETRFRMASVSKQFTAMAVYLLIQDEKLNFDTPIRNIFPELPVSCKKIQIQHLLNHTSGLVDYENVIPTSQKMQLSDADVLKLIQNLDTVYFEPGTQFQYSNTAYCLLSLVVERVSKQPFEDFCRTRIFHYLGMQDAQISASHGFERRAFGYHPKDSVFQFADQSITSATRGDGGVYISADDFGKWLGKKNPLLSARFFKDLETYKVPVKDEVYYSLGFFFTKSEDGNLTLFHSGESIGFHNIMLFQPQHDLIIALFTNRDDKYIVKVWEIAMKDENIIIPNIKESLFLWLNKVYNGDI